MLNNIRDVKADMLQPVGRANTREELEALIERETVEPYSEPAEGVYAGQTWVKTFRRGGPLEWHNPPSIFDHFLNAGTEEEWVEQARQQYHQEVLSIPIIPLDVDGTAHVKQDEQGMLSLGGL